MILDILLFILICYGLTQIIVYGKIFNSIRPKSGFFGDLFNCSLCIGFHVGYIVALLSNHSSMLFSNSLMFVDYLFLAFVSSGTSYILDKLVDDDGLRIKK